MFLSITYLLALVFILTLHEASHAWVAVRLGDPTAERAGRLSLNPLRHLDFLGTLMLFFAGIGWGKPVPVNPRNFEKPFRDEALTALAGPAMNLILAFLAAIPYTYLSQTFWLWTFSGAVLDLSLVLCLFNLMPFPPLDGSKFLILLVPVRYRESYYRFLTKSTAYFVAFMVIDLYFLGKVFGFSLVWSFVSTATFWLKTALLVIV
jgi:Zn-dependent protease